MSPEQLFETAAVGPYSDVWAMGIILYEMLMGRPPFEAPKIAQAIAWLSSDKLPPSLCAENPEVPPALEEVIFRCFARRIADRTPDVAVLAGDLLEAIGAPNADAVYTTLDSILANHAPRESARGLAVGGEEGASRSARGGRALSSQRRLVAARRKKPATVFAVVLAILVGFVGFWISRRPTAPAAAMPAPASVPSVHVTVRAMPAEAKIEVDGADRGSGTSSFDVAPDNREHAIHVSAQGYAPEERTVQFSRDLQVDISLEKLNVAAAASEAASAASPSSRATPRGVARPKPSAAAAESTCTPPYYFSNGIKTFKPECL
jgi:serine/threonine-protein kinase